MEKAYQNEMKNNIDSLIKNDCLSGKAVFAFGHCNATEEMIDYLNTKGIKVDAILDNNESKHGMYYRSSPVIKPEVIRLYDASNSVVLIAARAYASMAEQLCRLNYCFGVYKVVDYNSFAEYSLSTDAFVKKKERVIRGIDTLNRIKKRHPALHLVICPNKSLGDVYWALSFLPSYCKKHNISKVVVLVIDDGCRQVAELFKIAKIVTLDVVQMDELVQAILFTREDNYIIAQHDRPYTDNIIRYLDNSFLSFVDFYRYGVYGLDKDAAPKSPKGHITFLGKEQIRKGKTVILSPYAKSVVQIPDAFWESIAADYQQKGYLVCTNVAEDENPVKRTIPISVPINQIVSAVEYAGHFIGIRNGLCDILSTAECRKTVILPNCIYSTTCFRVDEFFDMPGWGKIVWDTASDNL